MWKHEIPKMYEVLPKKKKKLSILLQEERPTILQRSNKKIFVKKEELQYVASLIPAYFYEQVKLPFIFQQREDYYVFEGTKLENLIIEKALDLTDHSPYLLMTYTPRSFYHKYQITTLRKKLSTLVILIFTFSR